MQDKIEPEQHRFGFSDEEWACLQYLASKDPRIARLAHEQVPINSNLHAIDIRSADAQELRGYLTEHLAQLGFDKEYELNEQGRLLEELIDRLFVP
jgi:hypothetical protein